MSRESLIILIGIIVFFAPSLGIPEAWRMYVLTGCGIFLILLGYLLRRAAYMRSTDRGNGERATDSFVESSGKDTTQTIQDEVHV